MPRHLQSPDDFTIIGENIHTTRIVLRRGRRVVEREDGVEGIPFQDADGNELFMAVPEHFKTTGPYEQGQIKHFMIAVWLGLNGGPDEQALGAAYVHREIRRQTAAGASFLDLNVDEVSPNLDIQKESMRWLVETVQAVATVPPSIDSSNAEIMETGLDTYDGRAGRPMINSVALERIEAIDLVKAHQARVIVTAAGESGMPADDAERVDNVTRVMEHVTAAGIPLDDVHVDCLVFPISVDGTYGGHYLNAVAAVRERFGPEIHLTGGISNVSFGLPKRRLINDAFLYLALEHGLDSGIIDPIATKVERALEFDTEAEPQQLALDMLRGNDEYCMNFIGAFRAGKLD